MDDKWLNPETKLVAEFFKDNMVGYEVAHDYITYYKLDKKPIGSKIDKEITNFAKYLKEELYNKDHPKYGLDSDRLKQVDFIEIASSFIYECLKEY